MNFPGSTELRKVTTEARLNPGSAEDSAEAINDLKAMRGMSAYLRHETMRLLPDAVEAIGALQAKLDAEIARLQAANSLATSKPSRR